MEGEYLECRLKCVECEGEGGLIYIFLVSNLCQMRALIDDQHQLKSILGLSGVEAGREGMGKGAVRSY